MDHYAFLRLLDAIKDEWNMLSEEDQVALYYRLVEALEPS
jgi:hypothetical protein